MFKSYLTIAWRNMVRHKVFTVLNVLGLALGICACIVIYQVSHYELSFDRFHPDKERIYRVRGDVTNTTGDISHFANLPYPLPKLVRSSMPGFEAVAGWMPYDAQIRVTAGDNTLKQFDSEVAGHYPSTALVEQQWFSIFNYEWLAGNAATALNAPFKVVLTEKRAREYFGRVPIDAMIGKQVVYDDSLVCAVSGVVKDWEGNSDLGFTDLISFSTLEHGFFKRIMNFVAWGPGDPSISIQAFAKLSRGVTDRQLDAPMAALIKPHAVPQLKLKLWLEPLADIHFNADVIENPTRTAHLPTLYSLMGIAVFILLLAIVNFINLSTAQTIRRAKEVGVRKVLGSSRGSLLLQFLTETWALSFLALLLAICFVKPVFYFFRSLIPTGVSFRPLEPSMLGFFLVLTLVTTLLAGLYPAKLLAGYKAAASLKGVSERKGGEAWVLRRALIVFQFCISLIFIIGSIVIASQLRYTREKDLGFTSDAIINIQTPWGSSYPVAAVLAQKLKQLPGVSGVALEWVPPMTDNTRVMRIKFRLADEKPKMVTQVAADEVFIPLYKIKLVAGHNLTASDSVNEFVINEKLSAMMGNKKPEDAIGKTLYWGDRPYPVVGVVADFHTNSLHDPITPLCIINRQERERALAVKLASAGEGVNSVKTVLSQMELAWKQVFPSTAFEYRFFDESLALLYEKDRQTAMLTNAAMGVTIFISCMGLFGLALFMAEKRAKEISIRKVMGASVANIVSLLSRDFVVLVLLAIVISAPAAWWLSSRWLQGFAYHIGLNGWMFLAAGLIVLFITLVTVGFQGIKAALVNPVRNLRTE
jgi:putative ABC transport system permease protein